MSGQQGAPYTATAAVAPRRAVLYVRISDDPEGTEKGVDRQEADCRAYCEAQGLSVVEVFKENDTSAFKQRTIVLPSGEKVRRVVRPKFHAMLRSFAGGGADVMVAYDLDRAVRDPRDLEDLIDAKVLHGFAVASTTGSLRLDSDADIAMARVLVAMANKSSADTARRVKRAARQQAVEGRWHGGRAPFGYVMGESTLTVVPERAALVRETADRVLAGESVYMITRTWNERGERTPGGGLWNESLLVRILRNPALKGLRSYRPVRPDGSQDRDGEPELLTRGNWPPILAPELWDRVNSVMAERRERHKARVGAKRIYPFSGIIRCARCGTAMRRQGPSYVCLNGQRGVCSRRVNGDEIEELVEDALMSVFAQVSLDPRRLSQNEAEAATRRQELALSVDADRAALRRLDDDHYDGIIGRADWMRQRARLVERITVRQRERRQRLAKTPLVDMATLDLSTVASEWRGRPPQWRHDAARTVLEAVLIGPHPEGVPCSVSRRRGETEDDYQDRRRAYRAELLPRRVEFVWRA
ncbi:MAG: recombinase family protein [Bifidobacteriaceae bacterium]|jgi:DNA invertase Pin-like site-specific DNA recombinase|nr:recombinase family protein [Bifidobacteriaceae bacterium]